MIFMTIVVGETTSTMTNVRDDQFIETFCQDLLVLMGA
jgi:hypothetical protein